MWERYSLVGVLVSLVIILVDLYLLRKRKIDGGRFVLWFIVGLGLGLFSGIPPLFSLLWAFLGTEYTVSSIVGAGFLFFLSAFFYLDYRIYRLEIQLTKLAMEFSVTRYHEKRSSSSDAEKKTLKKGQRKRK